MAISTPDRISIDPCDHAEAGAEAGDPKDLSRFFVEVPRYTSYPTAADFSPEVGPDQHAVNLRDAARAAAGGPIALYVHLPFCREICHFCGCHALVARTDERRHRYLTALVAEARLVAAELRTAGGQGQGREVAELHFGGGSPSFVEADEFERLFGELRACFPFAANAAISIEADPRTTTREKLECYRRLGIGRISFGFQDLDEGVQRAIGRNQSAATSRAVFQMAREVGFEGINVDLCYGLPEQTAETFARTVDEVIALGPDRVALFGYAHVPWVKPKQRLIVASTLPGSALRLALMADARRRLLGAGYQAIGLDHFALPGDELARAAREKRLHRNFQGYTTTRTDTLIGLGLSAISDLAWGYAQNQRGLRDYYAAVDAGRLPTERGVARTDDDRLRGDVIRRLMCQFEIDVRQVEAAFGIDFATRFAPELQDLRRHQDDGLVVTNDDRIELTPLGRTFVRNVAATFDAHRRRPPEASAAPPRFSCSA